MKKFTMIDESFICENCGKKVEKLGYTARDHCPYCLTSKHVDVNPGDRSSECHGILIPIAIDKKKDRFQIVYQCKKCMQIKRNIVADDDNMNLILDIMSNPIDLKKKQ